MSRSERAASDLPPFTAAFKAGTRFARVHGVPIEMSTRQLGDFLRVPSGRLVVGDPGLIDFAAPPPPFARDAPVGVFPVELALADLGYDGTRVACACVRFAAAPAVRWEPAPFAGRGAGESVYEVFHDIGCFFDAAARAAVDEATTQVWGEAMARNREGRWTWHVAEVGGAKVVMFSTGWGGGCFASYWGLDEQGGLAELVTDFGLLHEPVSEQVELSLSLPHGELVHPWLAARGISVRGLQGAETVVILRGPKEMRFYLSERMVPTERWTGDECRLEWKRNTPGLRLVICVSAGSRTPRTLRVARAAPARGVRSAGRRPWPNPRAEGARTGGLIGCPSSALPPHVAGSDRAEEGESRGRGPYKGIRTPQRRDRTRMYSRIGCWSWATPRCRFGDLRSSLENRRGPHLLPRARRPTCHETSLVPPEKRGSVLDDRTGR